MKVIVDDVVVKEIDSFYSAAMSRHITLSEETVMAKKKRLIEALDLGKKLFCFTLIESADVVEVVRRLGAGEL